MIPPIKARARSIALIALCWLILQVGCLFSPGLMDDVDSVYIEVAREMLHRHDFVTPYVDGIRFFDKPPLMYWLAAGSMRVFGEHDWAARIPLALAVLWLLFAVYGLGRRFFGERGGLYSALALGTSIGPYLYTRFYIPDIPIALCMTLGVHLFLLALDRAANPDETPGRRSYPAVGFAAVLACNLLTKGLIGLMFPLLFVFLYLLLTRQFGLLRRVPIVRAFGVFVLLALPWHILAAVRNPRIAMPPGLGLPARAGWAWFYLYNEHVARFLGRRIPHDYGNTPVWQFWLYAVIWIMPWGAFLPAASMSMRRALGHKYPVTLRQREAALTLCLWAAIVLLFFTVSNRQEYYSLPALPALAIIIGGALAGAETASSSARAVLLCHLRVLLPLSGAIACVCGYFALTAPHPAQGVDLAALLAVNQQRYNLSLGHLFDLTAPALGLFRGPLAVTAAGMLIVGAGSYLLRRAQRHLAANLTVAGGMTVVLLAAHTALVRFNPILGSEVLADAILAEQAAHPASQGPDKIVIDGELTSGSTLLFYSRQPVSLVDGRINGPWFGSFWPDAPPIFEDGSSLRTLWASPTRVFLMTRQAASRLQELPNARVLATAGGKSILVNQW